MNKLKKLNLTTKEEPKVMLNCRVYKSIKQQIDEIADFNGVKTSSLVRHALNQIITQSKE